jgi:hypothetical protein
MEMPDELMKGDGRLLMALMHKGSPLMHEVEGLNVVLTTPGSGSYGG